MAQILRGDRIGAETTLKVGCAAVLFDDRAEGAESRQILLTRRSDNGQWCLPGGAMDPGEDVAEACNREFHEETGLVVSVQRMIGVYSSPDHVIRYADGNTHQFVTLTFEVKRQSGELALSGETTDIGFFSQEKADSLDIMATDRQWIDDARAREIATIIR